MEHGIEYGIIISILICRLKMYQGKLSFFFRGYTPQDELKIEQYRYSDEEIEDAICDGALENCQFN